MATPGTAPHQFDSTCDAEDVFQALYPKLAALDQRFRSVSEARFSASETTSLKHWFSDLRQARNWLDDPRQRSIRDVGTASNQEMFGALLLILASEVCRESSVDVWPDVTKVLEGTPSFPLLFDANRQPGGLFKKAVAAGARRFRLRELIDRDRQGYVDTVRLQFGFTFKSARRNLVRWLDGVGPLPARILLGEEAGLEHLESTSFIKLWGTMKDLRRRRVSPEYVCSALAASVWVRPTWSDELVDLIEKTARPASLFQVPATTPAIARPENTDESICALKLHWEANKKPRLVLCLNKERVQDFLGGCTKAAFWVDGQKVDSWTLQDDGEWRGSTELECQPRNAAPNLRPRSLTITDGDGKPLEELDESDLGTDEPVMIFDVKTGRRQSLTARMDMGRDYAFVCDREFSVPGALVEGKDPRAYLVRAPWLDTRVVCEELTYWRPSIGEEPPPQPKLGLESRPGEFVEPDSMGNVVVTGVPQTAKAVWLMIGRNGQKERLNLHGGRWQPEGAIRIRESLVLKQDSVRVGIDDQRIVVPRVALSVRGIARKDAVQGDEGEGKWGFLNLKRPLNRAGGAGYAKVLAETPGVLFEGAKRLGDVGRRPLAMRDLQGWGAPLTLVPETGPVVELVGSVEDQGQGRIWKSMIQQRHSINWRSPVEPNREHQVLAWPTLADAPRTLNGGQIECLDDGNSWRIRDSGQVAALAVAHQGERIASTWTCDLIKKMLLGRPSHRVFALLRWLHVPVLGPELRDAMAIAVRQAPAEFIIGWKHDESLKSLIHERCQDGLDTVVRALLWDHFEKNEATLDRIAGVCSLQANGISRSAADVVKDALVDLQACPSLAYAYAAKKLLGDKSKKWVRDAAARMVHLPEGIDLSQIRFALRDIGRGLAGLVGLSPEELEMGIQEFGGRMDNPMRSICRFDDALRRVGETSHGPEFLSAALLVRLLERSRI